MRRLSAFVVFVLLLKTLPGQNQTGQNQTGQDQTTAAATLQEAKQVLESGDRERARRLLEQTLDQAMKEADPRTEAEARFLLADAYRLNSRYQESDSFARAALALFEKLDDKDKQAACYVVLGTIAWARGQLAQARASFESARALQQALGNLPRVAMMYYDLALVSPPEDKAEYVRSGLELARKSGARLAEALLLHVWADANYLADDFDAAFERLNQARAILEDIGDRPKLARVLTSPGRLYRVHGQPDQALLYYQRARDMLQAAGDVQGVIQSLQAMGFALNVLGRPKEALRVDQEALQLARERGASFLVKDVLESVSSTQIRLGKFEQAAATLEEAHQIQPPTGATARELSYVRWALGQYQGALQAAEEGVQLSPPGEGMRDALTNRALALWKLGRTEEASRDIRQVMESIEQARAKLIPQDFMKEGFSNTDRDLTSLAIQILLDRGEVQEALEIAERARGRAFLDLMAAKNAAPKPAQPASSEPRLASIGDILALAQRLQSTILEYWIDDHGTIIWSISPGGRIQYARTAFGRDALDNWIDEALGYGEDSRPSTGVPVATRGGDTMLTSGGNQKAWRQMYDALLRPVRSSLPKKGGRLTIIPSGPLFRLSFAALQDEKGRYLVEDYAIHYSPAVEVFRYTSRAGVQATDSSPKYLFVANPAHMPSANGRILPPLPGSESEVATISKLAAPAQAIVLRGAQAGESNVRQAMATARVIHLATHGIANSARPLESFLALDRGNDPLSNGKLTAEKIYALDLHADLVFLSACRTGIGRISGDGVAGLARAFLYAGSASVISTLWDVADQPAAQLTGDFYRSAAVRTASKDEALRRAQVHLLNALRKGQLSLDTPLGKLTLPEDPLLWAGFILIGEP